MWVALSRWAGILIVATTRNFAISGDPMGINPTEERPRRATADHEPDGVNSEIGQMSPARDFLDLLEPIQDGLYRHARRMAWREHLIADIVQEAVMTAWREFDRFERGTNFRAWVFTILTNTIYRFNKKVSRQRALSLDDVQADWDVVMQSEDVWSSLRDDPQRLMQSLDERLVRALSALGPDEKQCLLLRLLEGFTYREISSMLKIPVGTVMSHVYRARMQLRERLASLAVEHGMLKETVA